MMGISEMLFQPKKPPREGPLVRDPERMSQGAYDLLIVGGGITGACIAWDASLRGLRTALIEKDDFGGATSAATSKLIHGGLRYLKQREFGLVRESLHERRILERIAPHLVRPIPFLIPTYKGHQGRVPLTIGMIVYELLAYDGPRTGDDDVEIPHYKHLSVEEVLETVEGVPQDGLTGGMRYYDCQMFSPERLTLEFLLSAAERGAVIANYTKAAGWIVEDGRVKGVRAEDRLGESTFEVRAEVTVNVTGPWADLMLDTLPDRTDTETARIVRSKGIHLITRPIVQDTAVVLILNNGRHAFLIPWRDHTIIGTTDTAYTGHPDDLTVTEEEIDGFIREINEVWPNAKLHREDVLSFYAGLRPLVEKETEVDTYNASRTYEIFNHAEEGFKGLFTVIGGKYTTSRNQARKLVNRVFAEMETEHPSCKTETTPLYGGNVGRFEPFLERAVEAEKDRLPESVVVNLVKTYGSRYRDVVDLVRQEPELGERLHPDLPEIGAQVIHAVRKEMAFTLKDVLFRRTGLGTIMHPGRECLERTCRLMARELRWKRKKVETEIDTAESAYRAG